MAVTVAEKSRKVLRISGALEALESRSVPQWVEINKEAFEEFKLRNNLK